MKKILIIVFLTGRMAGSTIVNHNNFLLIVFFQHFRLVMTGKAGVTRQGVCVAGLARIRPSMIGWKSVRTIKSSRDPRLDGVAVFTLETKHAHMISRFSMTTGTGGWQSLINPAAVTGLAGNVRVRAKQGKIRSIMIKRSWLPCGCRMAGGTISTELTGMRVIIEMARDAGRWRSLKHIIHMT